MLFYLLIYIYSPIDSPKPVDQTYPQHWRLTAQKTQNDVLECAFCGCKIKINILLNTYFPQIVIMLQKDLRPKIVL